MDECRSRNTLAACIRSQARRQFRLQVCACFIEYARCLRARQPKQMSGRSSDVTEFASEEYSESRTAHRPTLADVFAIGSDLRDRGGSLQIRTTSEMSISCVTWSVSCDETAERIPAYLLDQQQSADAIDGAWSMSIVADRARFHCLTCSMEFLSD